MVSEEATDLNSRLLLTLNPGDERRMVVAEAAMFLAPHQHQLCVEVRAHRRHLTYVILRLPSQPELPVHALLLSKPLAAPPELALPLQPLRLTPREIHSYIFKSSVSS